MKIALTNIFAAFGIVLCGVVAAPAATMTMSLYEDSGNVVFDFSGAVDMTGLSYLAGNAGGFSKNELWPVRGYVNSIPGGYKHYNVTYTGASDSSFGTGGYRGYVRPTQSISVGDTFGIGWGRNPDNVLLPFNYVSNSALVGSATFFGVTLAGIGATEGTYSASDAYNTFNLTVGAQVPLPAGLSLILTGLGALVLLRRRSRA